MKEQILNPGPQLLESMRAVGYSLKTALADIIDNSLAADSNQIEIFFSAESESPHIAVLDDGCGMTDSEALSAMKLAGVSVDQPRSSSDLGRFGLGLKTASLSQCRRLTVISARGGKVVGLRWDLDHIQKTDQWSLQILSDKDMAEVPRFSILEPHEHGTLVVWENLDTLVQQGGSLSKALDARMIEARDHLGLVFHQFIEGYGTRQKVSLKINFTEVEPIDPFFQSDRRTQRQPAEIVPIGADSITIQLFTLPVQSKMNASQRAKAQISGSMRDSQGFYVYRGGRLVIWGTWFRLAKKAEMGKLARVKVDIPNTLDSLWELDIKKSQAVPPDFIRERLRSLVARLQAPSEKAHEYRGRKTKSEDTVVRFWDVVEDRDSFRYEINRDHPLLQQIAEKVGLGGEWLVEGFVSGLESNFPVQDAVNRVSTDHSPAASPDDEEAWLETLVDLWHVFSSTGEAVDSFVSRMVEIEPFNNISMTKQEISDHLSDPERGST